MVEAPSSAHAGSSGHDRRAAAIDALMTLATQRAWPEIGLADIADRAGFSLAELREAFPSKGAILAGLARQIDGSVLQGLDPAMKEEPPRDRLFDILMRRLEALTPYKPGLKALRSAFRYDPVSLAALNRVVLTSMQWMLAAAGLSGDGLKGSLRAQGLVLVWTRILTVWFDDEDPALSSTMAEMDRQLKSAEWWASRAGDVWAAARPLRKLAACSAHVPARARDMAKDCAKRPSTRPDPDQAAAEAI